MTVIELEPPAAAEATGSRPTWATVPRVNLLPPEIVESRRFGALKRWLLVLLLVVLTAGAGATWWAHTRVVSAQAALEDARSGTAALQAKKAAFAEVPQVVAAVEAALAVREQAMAADVLWYRYLSDVALATSSDVYLSSMTLGTKGATASPAADPLSPAGIGTVQISGTAGSLPSVAAWLEALDQISGVKGSVLLSASRGDQDGDITFTTTSVLTTDALSHRYDRKAG